MSYKYYLQLLRGKLYEQFFAEMKGGGILPFMDPDVYGTLWWLAITRVVKSSKSNLVIFFIVRSSSCRPQPYGVFVVHRFVSLP